MAKSDLRRAGASTACPATPQLTLRISSIFNVPLLMFNDLMFNCSSSIVNLCHILPLAINRSQFEVRYVFVNFLRSVL